MKEWNVHGPSHYTAVGLRHIAGKLKKLGALTGNDCIQVC
jgi:L-arabinose isomerase